MVETPIRMCIACRVRRPQRELVRYRVDEQGNVTANPLRANIGRSAYTCRDEACINRALQRNIFFQAMRQRVGVDREQLRLEARFE